LKDDLTRAGLNVGFIVSGIRLWREELLHNGQMSGFLDNIPIEMPDITPELVCDVFNQRIKAFCYDRSPRRIKVDFVKRMFKEIEGQTGFRDYLTRIVSELSNNNLSIVDTPIEINETILSKIKSELESDTSLRSSLNELAFRSKFKRYTQEQIAKCFELLIQISIQDGIGEDDRLFIDNKYYFQRLRDVGLIQKSKVNATSHLKEKKQTSINSKQLRWVLRSNLQKAVDNIFTYQGFGVNDYLLKLYGWGDKERQVSALETKVPTEFLEIQQFFAKSDLNLTQSVADKIALAFRLIEPVLLADALTKQSPELIEKGFSAFSQLSQAFFEVDLSNLYFSKAGINLLEQQWKLHYIDDENLLELFVRVADYNSEKTISKFNSALKQLIDVFMSVANRLMLIIDDIRFKRSAQGGGLMSRNVNHTPEELRIFEEINKSFHSLSGAEHFN
jgi:hypothetical protein